MILTSDSCALVCYGCWSERHRRMGEELAKDPTKHMRAFHERAARAYASVGDEANAESARRLAASL